MPTIVHEFAWPDRVVVGTVGRPGSRTFYLQVRAGDRLVSVALEKEQSALLGEKVDEILDELMASEDNPVTIPTETPVELVDNDPLELPVEERFRTGAMTLGWDPTTAQVVIEVYPLVDEVEEFEPLESEPDEVLLVRIPVGTARAFAKRTLEIVGAGRRICPLCGQPMDPDGHDCAGLDSF
ncbi:MAG TPA: DUF3090 domain-containing protein [Lacisediminihabitans sp.]|uniref:DUF3090 domain-containing protein n=1 Tax=Lacisediminihabitans sp. TaxID=2787631 RepID=UPI002ED87462